MQTSTLMSGVNMARKVINPKFLPMTIPTLLWIPNVWMMIQFYSVPTWLFPIWCTIYIFVLVVCIYDIWTRQVVDKL